MGQIVSLAKALGGESTPNADPPPPQADPPPPQAEQPINTNGIEDLLGNLDPKLISLIMKMIQEYSHSDDRNVALLSALRPFLKEERLAKMDQAIQIAKFSRIARLVFQMLKGGEGTV